MKRCQSRTVSDADNIPAGASGRTARPKRDRDTLRVAPYQGSIPPPPVTLHLAHSLVGGELVSAEGAVEVPSLELPAGIAAEVELAFGRADPSGALTWIDRDDAAPDALVRATRARVALMSGDVERARAELGGAGEVEGGGAIAVADVALALAEDDLIRAERRLADALFARPQGLAETHMQALLSAARGDMGKAIQTLTAVARAAPSHAVARFQLGQIVLASGDAARAGTLFEMAWQIQPTFIAPLLALAEMLLEGRQYGEVLSLVAQASEAVPEAVAPRLLQLRVLLEVGEREAALELSTALYSQLASHPALATVHAEALAENDRVAEARVVLEAVAARPDLEAGIALRVQRQRARLALAEHPPRADEAVRMLHEAALSRAPGWTDICVELCHVCMALGRKKEAEDALTLLLGSTDPGSVVSAAALARSHGLWRTARELGEHARSMLAGTPAVAQLDGFLATLSPA